MEEGGGGRERWREGWRRDSDKEERKLVPIKTLLLVGVSLLSFHHLLPHCTPPLPPLDSGGPPRGLAAVHSRTSNGEI